METMHAAGRRTLPPVPRPSPARLVAEHADDEPDCDEPITERLELDLSDDQPGPADDGGPATERFQADLSDDEDDPLAGAAPVSETPPPRSAEPGAAEPGSDEPATAERDDAKEFVARLRSAGAEFAEAAGAASAVVCEVVPPARHRRARCRVILRYADGALSDVTFLGPAGSPGAWTRHGFDRQIRRWLGSGQHRADAWVVADPEAPDGVAVDVTAWLAAS
jgi:hypothetical protein